MAVKEFIETEGQLPARIEWVRNSDLPPGTSPDPEVRLLCVAGQSTWPKLPDLGLFCCAFGDGCKADVFG